MNQTNYHYHRPPSDVDKPALDSGQWVDVAAFENTAVTGWCWLRYKGLVLRAYCDCDTHPFPLYRHYPLCNTVYMSECISGVIV